jgi:hypothetical protein
MFNEAEIPNSINFSELVKIKVEKPSDVVRFVKNVAFPTF